jgi:DNA-3-methyladenine glycosylase I
MQLTSCLALNGARVRRSRLTHVVGGWTGAYMRTIHPQIARRHSTAIRISPGRCRWPKLPSSNTLLSRMRTTIEGPDGLARCRWSTAAPEFPVYHDTEWGFPVRDDRRLFELMCLESFQSGLSWRTILAKRENFRAAFRDFDFDQIARFAPRDVERLLKNEGIVRHRGKIEAVINNARRARELIKRDGSFAAFVWRYETDAQRRAARRTAATSVESVALSKELRRLGWAFVGPTTVHAFRQATGLINDHVEGCAIRSKVERARSRFRPPK